MPKPDESRLLTDEEILEGLNKNPFDCVSHTSLSDGYLKELRGLIKDQRDLIASIKDAEHKAKLLPPEALEETIQVRIKQKIEEIFREIKHLVKWTEKHYSPSGNIGSPDDTGGVINIGDEYYLISKNKLEALKDKYTKEEK